MTKACFAKSESAMREGQRVKVNLIPRSPLC